MSQATTSPGRRGWRWFSLLIAVMISAALASTVGFTTEEHNDPQAEAASASKCGAGKDDARFIDLGRHETYVAGKKKRVLLCALTNLESTSQESQPGQAYYVKAPDGKGAERKAIVRSDVAVRFYNLVKAAKTAGVPLVAHSSFRTHQHQKDLCDQNAACKACYAKRKCTNGYSRVAKPGTSNHQAATAIDFNVSARSGPAWNWLANHAHEYGISNYDPEPWHWSTTGN